MDDAQRDFLKKCGERLRAARLNRLDKDGKPLTLAKAAELVGGKGGKSMWRKWEQGSPPSAHTAWKVEQVLGIPHGTIWGGAPLPELDADEPGDDEADDAADDAPAAPDGLRIEREGFDQTARSLP